MPELYTWPPKSPGVGLKRHYFEKIMSKMNEFRDIFRSPPPGDLGGGTFGAADR